jgi:hypothetical protein
MSESTRPQEGPGHEPHRGAQAVDVAGLPELVTNGMAAESLDTLPDDQFAGSTDVPLA